MIFPSDKAGEKKQEKSLPIGEEGYNDIQIYPKNKFFMKQLFVKLSDEEYRTLEEYCRKTGRTKSAVIRHEISKLKNESISKLLHRKVRRISPGKGKLISELIREMRV